MCDPVTCPGDLSSYGKRRRREANMELASENMTQIVETETTMDAYSKRQFFLYQLSASLDL